MQEKVLSFLKENFKGISSALLFIVALIIGFAWGNENIDSLKKEDIVIEEVKATTTPAVASSTKSAPTYKVTIKKKSNNATITATVTPTSTPAQPIDYLRFFYGAGSVSSPAPAPLD